MLPIEDAILEKLQRFHFLSQRPREPHDRPDLVVSNLEQVDQPLHVIIKNSLVVGEGGEMTTTTRILLALSMIMVCSGGGLALADLTVEDIQASARRAAAADPMREAEVAQRDMEVQQRLEQTIARCVARVKEDLPYGRLDAYAEDGLLHSYGTQEARFKFYRCIVQSGYPLRPLEK